MSVIALATHDYGQGGVAMLVRCDSPEELELALGDKWEVITEGIADHSFWKYTSPAQHVVHDLASPTGLLEAILEVTARESEGKQIFPIRIGRWGRYRYREVWARSKEEVEAVFPNCKFLFNEIISGRLDRSDIDVRDEFIERYGKKYT